ncbi:MAG TPA: beta-ketoacyl synthase N-terminal-like domain-containing protein [Quisquiliibacterium sp.]|nr:beta-ketoacyl synthase N-terminal-like domain-containing protein [Quisquiliibacterium sp.]HQD84891.1 beta-ketoacyl synthase N-terminal-like domain-containing protein [Quisquiliibacterium sp.]HQN14434.1 beta-ketoacyl synthase N-terminal-like domain-containing protein [Quisquiliibacterium sp.]
MREVAIVGIGSTPFGRHAGTPIEQLGVRAAAEALLDAGIDRARIGAVYLGNFISGPLNGKEVLAGIVADQLGLPNVPCTKVEGACASGGIAFRHAWMAIASGQCDAALVVGVETMTHANTAQTTAALNCAMDNEHDGPSGLTFPGLFGLAWRIHAERHGTTRAQVSAVVRKNKRNGLLNPLAQMGADLSDDQIAASASICDPLQLYDCCPTSDGAAALVLVAKPLAREATGIPVDVLATVQTRGASRIAGHPDLCSFDATVSAAQRAYAMAGVTAADIDLVELHDCFSIAEIIDSEDLGLAPRGQGAIWAAEGRTAVGGQVAINPSGGLLAKGHPVGATGVGQLYEVVRQLRGTHANQVKGAEIGMTHNLGGTGVACTVSILRRSV